MKKILIGLALIIVVLLLVVAKRPAAVQTVFNPGNVNLQGASIPVQVADNFHLREVGLSGRTSLDQGTGMLFIFERPATYGFWMKDMTFPIDIIWILNNKVVHVENSVDPSSYPKVFYPSSEANFVLELPSGYAMIHNIKIGDPFSVN
ncbi:MAG: hypothetical protein JWN89_350 [Parcubacteria group bacterium]|nr:hypothetical protein [Parcubacteria group bacterium]